MEVYYHGTKDLLIDYFRFETPRAQQVFRGALDHRIDSAIKYTIGLTQSRADVNMKIFRFYGADEMIPMQWAANRYLNMLVDTLLTLETYVYTPDATKNPPPQYLWASGFKEYWNGSNVAYSTRNAVPYLKYGFRDQSGQPHPEYFNYVSGYAGNKLSIVMNDTLNSNYETFIDGFNKTLPVTSDFFDLYDWQNPRANAIWGVQYLIGSKAYNSYYKNLKLLYNAKPWWANLWVNCGPWAKFTTLGSFSLTDDASRPKTGEEIRVQINYPLILGAKGILYWKKTTNNNLVAASSVEPGLRPIANVGGSLTGENLIYSDLIGADFFNSSTDPNTMGSYYDASKYRWNEMELKQNRLYLGIKSTRAEIAKANKWIEAVQGTLLNLKLAAWFSKGFMELNSQEPGVNSNSKIQNFMPLNSANLKTRPIGRTAFEPWDSTFVDVTLLRNANDSNITSGTWYVGVFNKRTDPLIRTMDTATVNGVLRTDSSLVFYSTAELDMNVRNGGNTLATAIPSTFKDTTYWQNLWYKRRGSREIFLPFKVNGLSPYASLQVTELGIDSVRANPAYFWWKGPKFNQLADTIIDASGTLVLKMQPGEAKILKINVIQPSTQFQGFLNHSNQRKLIAYPVIGKADTVVKYYTVYNKPYDLSSSLRQMGVFFRSSEETGKSTPTEAIRWRPEEYLISAKIAGSKKADDTLRDFCCRYPSLAIRYDTLSNRNMAYVVYSAMNEAETSYPDTLYQSESVFNADTMNIAEVDGYSRVNTAWIIHKGMCRLYRNNDTFWDTPWAGPAINVSSYGNFYAFADSCGGITAGFKRPHPIDTVFRIPKLSFSAFTADNFTHNAFNPSLNTYSRFRLGENDCALVWCESNTNINRGTNNGIYYTRLYLNAAGTAIEKQLPQTICSGWDPTFTYSMIDPTIICINTNNTRVPISINNGVPMVYRGVEEYSMPQPGVCCEPQAVHNDIVYWQGHDIILNRDVVFFNYMPGFDRIENNRWVPDCFYPWGSYSFQSLNGGLYSPNAAQGYIMPWRRNDTTYHSINNDSNVVVNFMGAPSATATYNTCVWQVNHGFNSITGESGTLLNGFEKYKYSYEVLGEGSLPQLAAMPYVRSGDEYKFNRRIFNAPYQGINPPPSIISSRMGFYKRSGDYETGAHTFFGFRDSTGKSMMTCPHIYNDNGELLPVRIVDATPQNGYKELHTDWMPLGDINRMNFLACGGGINTMKFYIERQSDGKLFKVNTDSILVPLMKSYDVTILNGRNQMYRLYIKKADSASFSQDIILDVPTNFVTDTLTISGKKSADMGVRARDVIDLGEASYSDAGMAGNNLNITVIPNPASSDMIMTVRLPESLMLANREIRQKGKITLRLYSAIGNEVASFRVNPGEALNYNVEHLNSGTYFVRAELEGSNDILPAFRGFVVSK